MVMSRKTRRTEAEEEQGETEYPRESGRDFQRRERYKMEFTYMGDTKN